MLVAAAAGSGKTAVLVQRAIQRLTDPENPTSADRMLIVTFTKAAAAEMRARLEARLHQMLREDPGDPHLRRQSVLLAQLSSLIFACDGVANCKVTAPGADVAVSVRQLPVLGALTVEELA